MTLETYKDEAGTIVALVIRNEFRGKKYNFVTKPQSSFQLGVSFYQPGDTVKPHIHIAKEKRLTDSQECIFVKKGSMKFYVFDNHRNLIGETILSHGDIALQLTGGHAFKVLKDCQIIEVKQGPFDGEKDKELFDFPLP